MGRTRTTECKEKACDIRERFVKLCLKKNKLLLRKDLKPKDIKLIFAAVGSSIELTTIKKHFTGSSPRVPTEEDTAFMAYVILDQTREEELSDDELLTSEFLKKRVEEIREQRGEPLPEDCLMLLRLRPKGQATGSKAPEAAPSILGPLFTMKNRDEANLVAMGAYHFLSTSRDRSPDAYQQFVGAAEGCFVNVPVIECSLFFRKVDDFLKKSRQHTTVNLVD